MRRQVFILTLSNHWEFVLHLPNCVLLSFLHPRLHSDIAFIIQRPVLWFLLILFNHVPGLITEIVLRIGVLLQQEDVLVNVISSTLALVLSHFLLDLELVEFALQVSNSVTFLLDMVFFRLEDTFERFVLVFHLYVGFTSFFVLFVEFLNFLWTFISIYDNLFVSNCTLIFQMVHSCLSEFSSDLKPLHRTYFCLE